jgi:hypothetical protein
MPKCVVGNEPAALSPDERCELNKVIAQPMDVLPFLDVDLVFGDRYRYVVVPKAIPNDRPARSIKGTTLSLLLSLLSFSPGHAGCHSHRTFCRINPFSSSRVEDETQERGCSIPGLVAIT